MLNRYLDDRGYGSITHSGQDMGTTRMPANGLGKHNAVRLHDDTLLGGRVPSRAAACTQLKDVMRSETSQSPRHRHREARGPGVPGESHSQTEMRRCAPGAGRQHLAGGGGATAARTHVTLLNATLKTDRNGKFYVMCILPPFKKKTQRRVSPCHTTRATRRRPHPRNSRFVRRWRP